VIVRFVDIDGINDHHRLSFLFICFFTTSFQCQLSPPCFIVCKLI